MADPLHSEKQVFFEEADELIDKFEQNLRSLIVNDVDNELVNVAFRAVHTLKGGSAIYGIEPLADLLHLMESPLERARTGQIKINQTFVTCLLSSVGVLRDMVSHYKSDEYFDEAQMLRIKYRLRQLIVDQTPTESTDDLTTNNNGRSETESSTLKQPSQSTSELTLLDRLTMHLTRYFVEVPFGTAIATAIILGGATNSVTGLVCGFLISLLISKMLQLHQSGEGEPKR
jgi:two-component system chemotaxis sensor kinase CheA